MYNLFIGYIGPDDTENEITVSASRYLEYSDSETMKRFGTLDSENVHELKSYPGLFMSEHCGEGAFVAEIKSITKSNRDYVISFERKAEYSVIPEDVIKKLALELDIDEFEFYRTHWAVKNVNLSSVISDYSRVGDSLERVTEKAPENKVPPQGAPFNENQVFIVHGHDEYAKKDVSDYVKSKGLEPIILHEQASGGRTIIEKIDHYSNVGFGIVLYTECDVGAKRDTTNYKWRARQNVVFEHGYLIAKLSRERVAALVKGTVETPNDISGVVYVAMDPAGNWKNDLDNELRNAGYSI